MGRINPLVAVGIPTFGRVSVNWARAFKHLSGPLGSSTIEIVVENKPIAIARNELMQGAISSKADFLFMLGDDVLPPPDVLVKMIQRMWDKPDIHMLTGVYWTKMYPTHPYIWRGLQKGPYLDWKYGEFFPVDWAGCDCLLLRLSPEIKALGPDWFSTDWVWEPSQEKPDVLATEDFYFYVRAKKAGLDLWCDTDIQCGHEDRNSGQMFGLLADMPQAGAEPLNLPEPQDGKLVVVADIGSGRDTPYFGDSNTVQVVRFDGDETVRPDYRCDVRQLPVKDGYADLVHSRHVLEHFGRGETMKVLGEWLRILHVGGQLLISVPNFLGALEWIIKMDAGEVPPDKYPWWQIYGGQSDHRDFHHNGFSERRLRLLLERTGILGDIEVTTSDGGINLKASATKVKNNKFLVLTDEWEAIHGKLNAETEEVI